MTYWEYNVSYEICPRNETQLCFASLWLSFPVLSGFIKDLKAVLSLGTRLSTSSGRLYNIWPMIRSCHFLTMVSPMGENIIKFCQQRDVTLKQNKSGWSEIWPVLVHFILMGARQSYDLFDCKVWNTWSYKTFHGTQSPSLFIGPEPDKIDSAVNKMFRDVKRGGSCRTGLSTDDVILNM